MNTEYMNTELFKQLYEHIDAIERLMKLANVKNVDISHEIVTEFKDGKREEAHKYSVKVDQDDQMRTDRYFNGGYRGRRY